MADHSTRKPVQLVLLDRDGVINHDSPERIKSVREWRPIASSLAAVARLSAAGIHTALCSNQSGIGRGIFGPRDLAQVHVRLRSDLAAAGGRLDLVRYCPHAPDSGCPCRKPAPGMALDCMRELRCEPDATWFVGDSVTDVEAARNSGCRAVLVRTGNGAASERDALACGVAFVADDLAGAVDGLLARAASP